MLFTKNKRSIMIYFVIEDNAFRSHLADLVDRSCMPALVAYMFMLFLADVYLLHGIF